MDQLHPVLDARTAVGNLREVVHAENLLVGKAEGAMVGGDDLQMIVFQPIPQLRLIFLLTQRRCQDPLRVLEGVVVHRLFEREQKILRARFRKGRQPAVARLAHLIQRVFAGEMNDIHRRAGDLGHGNRSLNGLGFGDRGTCECVINGRCFSVSQRLLHDDVNDAAVLGVHADERAILRRLLQRLEDGGIIDHQHVGIGHEQLETGHALAHHVVHVFETRRAEVGDDHVQPVVDAGLALGLLPPGVERGAHLCTLRLDGEVDNGRRSADGRGARAGLKVVR